MALWFTDHTFPSRLEPSVKNRVNTKQINQGTWHPISYFVMAARTQKTQVIFNSWDGIAQSKILTISLHVCCVISQSLRSMDSKPSLWVSFSPSLKDYKNRLLSATLLCLWNLTGDSFFYPVIALADNIADRNVHMATTLCINITFFAFIFVQTNMI